MFFREKMKSSLISLVNFRIYRSSHRRCSIRKGVLRNFAKFTRNHLCQSPFFNKVAGPGLQLYLKETLAQVCEISKNPFSTEHLGTTTSECIKLINIFLHPHLIKLSASKMINNNKNMLV